jgi:hypothetical protein
MTMPKSKRETSRSATFASGGGSNKMFGKGDRTKTAPSDAASRQAQGVTGHKTSGQNLKQATGGPKTPRGTSAVLPARPGRTGAVPDQRKGR